MILLIVIFVCRPLSWIRPPNVSRSPAPSERGHRVARERRAASGAARCYAAYHCSQIAARCRPPRATLVVNWLTTNRLLPLDVFLRKLCDTERPETLRSSHRHIHDRRQQVVLRFGGGRTRCPERSQCARGKKLRFRALLRRCLPCRRAVVCRGSRQLSGTRVTRRTRSRRSTPFRRW